MMRESYLTYIRTIKSPPEGYYFDDDGNLVNENTDRILNSDESIDDIIAVYFKQWPLSSRKLHKKIEEDFQNVPFKKVHDFYLSTDIAVGNKSKLRGHFVPIKSHTVGTDLMVDLVDMQSFSSKNNRIRYLLTIIDVASRFLTVIPLKDKTTTTVIEKLEPVIKRVKNKILRSDNGSEFISNEFQEMLQKYGIRHITGRSHTPQTQGLVEVANRTIKQLIFSYMEQEQTEKYIDQLDRLVQLYNGSYHSSLEMTPTAANSGDFKVERKINIKEGHIKYPKGTIVRLATTAFLTEHRKNVFRTGVRYNWSYRRFIVKNIAKRDHVYKYTITTLEGDRVPGTYYDRDLMRTAIRNEKLANRDEPLWLFGIGDEPDNDVVEPVTRRITRSMKQDDVKSQVETRSMKNKN